MSAKSPTIAAAVASDAAPAKFGMFGGVFTPSILTIFGVILFMRAGLVIGQAGIVSALVILLVSKSITLFTGFSISAITTNTEVKSGGAYFLISRTLGPEFGGAIGLALYFAQALSVPFYILGFTEALTKSVPFMSLEALSQPLPVIGTWFALVNLLVLILLFVITFIGADWALKAQYAIMAILALSIVTFLAGAFLQFDSARLQANLASGYTEGYDFWRAFAIYFPAATGIMAGVNMSGNLKNPTRAIPLGTILAIIVGLAVYGLQIVVLGGAVDRESLVQHPYESLLRVSIFGMGFMVAPGVVCATLSSGLGSFLGAPRILQALAQDKILRPLNPFATLSKNGEPHRALLVTFALSLAVIYYAREGSTGGALNAIATIITMLFLCTYGITNLAAFVESFGANPSFRPRFKLFHWSIALLGALGCIFAAFLINALFAMLAILIIVLLFLYVRRFILSSSFGDARRGFFYSRVRDNLLKLSHMPVHPKNWRPTLLALSGNPETRFSLVNYAHWLGSGRGIVTLASVITGKLEEKLSDRADALKSLNEFIGKNRLQAFPEVLVAEDFDTGLHYLLQCVSLQPIKPNLLVWGWSSSPDRARRNVQAMLTARAVGISQVIVKGDRMPGKKGRGRRIDIWWRGKQNGSLMVILAHLVSLNQEWSGCGIRILRVVSDQTYCQQARSELTSLMAAARMENANVAVIVAEQDFSATLHKHSADATLVFLGFRFPTLETASAFQERFSVLLDGMPTTMLVHSTGEADLMS
jgi:amino acid transporter